jgi:hypothetical protein
MIAAVKLELSQSRRYRRAKGTLAEQVFRGIETPQFVQGQSCGMVLLKPKERLLAARTDAEPARLVHGTMGELYQVLNFVLAP